MPIIAISIFFILDINYFFNNTELAYVFISKLSKLLIISVFRLVLPKINFCLALYIYFLCDLYILLSILKKLLTLV